MLGLDGDSLVCSSSYSALVPGLGGDLPVSGSSSSALVPGLGDHGRLAVLGKGLKVKKPVPEIVEEETQANGHVPASVKEGAFFLVSGSICSALVPRLGGDGRLAELRKELKANKPLSGLGEEGPQANAHDSASAADEFDSRVSGSSSPALVPGLCGDSLVSESSLSTSVPGLGRIGWFLDRVLLLWCLG